MAQTLGFESYGSVPRVRMQGFEFYESDPRVRIQGTVAYKGPNEIL